MGRQEIHENCGCCSTAPTPECGCCTDAAPASYTITIANLHADINGTYVLDYDEDGLTDGYEDDSPLLECLYEIEVAVGCFGSIFVSLSRQCGFFNRFYLRFRYGSPFGFAEVATYYTTALNNGLNTQQCMQDYTFDFSDITFLDDVGPENCGWDWTNGTILTEPN